MKRSLAFFVALFATTSILAQSRALNPTVKVGSRTNIAIPAECEEGAVPQPTPRVQVAEIPQERETRAADMQAPRSNDLRTQFRELHAVAGRGDREEFTRMLAVVRGTVAAYPPGGEKSAASESIAVYSDIDRLWAYQYSSPTGAFFDPTAQDGALLKMLNSYRGFEEAMRRDVIVDSNGTRLYPTRESRDFLLREASQRIARLGVRSTAPAVVVAPSPVPEKPRASSTTPPPPPRVARASRPVSRRPRSTTSAPSKKQRTRHSAKRTSPIPSPSKSVVEEPPVPPGVISTPSEPPQAAAVATQTETSPATIDSVPPPVTTMATETTATRTSEIVPADDTRPTPAQRSARGRNIIMPLVLILIGVGVLIVLFRASS
ncbi:MAG: hypothetical protein JJE51_08165 [Thermoanaerobaculia bacterium]|nr:hypothetical protein [Thermoanaerobaculia bacterium]